MTERSSRYRSNTGCLVCKKRKVKCDETQGGCTNCSRLQVQCPGYEVPEDVPRQDVDLSATVDGIFRTAGVTRRVLGSCYECRATKARCDKQKPQCGRCLRKRASCTYSKSSRRAGSVQLSQGSLNDEFSKDEGSSKSSDVTAARSTIPSSLEDGSIAWLFADSPPKEPHLRKSLADSFFKHIHPLRCLSFIHRATFMQALDRGMAEKEFGEALVLILFALAARYTMRTIAPNVKRTTEIPGEKWADKALSLALHRLGEPSVQNLMALVLLCEYKMRSKRSSSTFMLTGCCCRLAQLLRFDIEASDDTISGLSTAGQITELESRRRLMWSCYSLDVFVGSGVENILMSSRLVPKIQLPRQSRDFDLQIESSTGTFSADDLNWGLRDSKNLGIEAFYVLLMFLRGQVLRHIRRSDEMRLPWLPDSEFMQLVYQLEMWEHSLPPHLVFNDLNSYIHKDQNQLAAFFILHILYNQCFCDLYRVVLPGYNFPVTALFASAPTSFVEEMQRKCRQYAKTVTQLIRSGLQHGKDTFDDTMCVICAYEATKLQVIYVSTCAGNQPLLWSEIAQDVQTNITLLKLMESSDTKRRFLEPLVVLLRKFGFPDLSMQLQDDIGLRKTDQSEQFAPPPGHDHMHPLSTYRLAWNEISWRHSNANANANAIANEQRRAVNKTPQTQQSPHPEDNVAMWEQGAVTQDMAVELPYLDAEALLTSEEYALMADGIQDYLTWDPFFLTGEEHAFGME